MPFSRNKAWFGSSEETMQKIIEFIEPPHKHIHPLKYTKTAQSGRKKKARDLIH